MSALKRADDGVYAQVACLLGRISQQKNFVLVCLEIILMVENFPSIGNV